MRVSKDILLLAGLFIALALGLHYFARPKQVEENKVSSSYNADPMGTKALYTLLGDRLGYNVDRLTTPFDKMPAGARTVVIVEPDRPAMLTSSDDDWGTLADWVRNGGTLIYASAQAYNPLFSAGFGQVAGTGGSFGKGKVYVLKSGKPLTNRGMRDHRNVVDMVTLVTREASKEDLILFDEYHHGFAQSKPLIAMLSRPVRMSLIVFAIAGLLAAYSRGRRFGAVREAPAADTLRPGSEFVEAVGRLYRRAGATDVAMDIVRDSFLPRLYRKLGVPPESSSDYAVSRASAVCGEDCAAAVARLLKSRSAGHKPSEQELLNTTREIQQLEKELGLEPNRS